MVLPPPPAASCSVINAVTHPVPSFKHQDTSSTLHFFRGWPPRSRFNSTGNSQDQVEYLFHPWTTSQGLTWGSSVSRNDRNVNVWRLSIFPTTLGLPIAFTWWCLKLFAWSNHFIIIIMDSRWDLCCFQSTANVYQHFRLKLTSVTHTRCYFAYCY